MRCDQVSSILVLIAIYKDVQENPHLECNKMSIDECLMS